MTATGKCLCGAVTFQAEGVDPHLHACHCDMCRAWSGAALLATAVDSVRFAGAGHVVRYDSSEWAARGFCGRCGSNLFFHLKEPDRYLISLGAFDDQAGFELAGEIFIDRKPPGYRFAGDHPRQTGEEFLASLQPG